MHSSLLKPLSLFALAVCIIVLVVQTATTRYDTFDFESAHTADGVVSQTVAGVTLRTEGGSGETRVSALRGFGGTAGRAVLSTSRSLVLHFDAPINLVSLRLAESTSSATSRTRTVTFESDTGESLTRTILDGYRGGAEVALAFEGIQTLTITDGRGDFAPIVDDVTFYGHPPEWLAARTTVIIPSAKTSR